MKVIKKILFTFITSILGILLAINLYSFISIKLMEKDLATIFGYSTLEVVSGSMEPTIHIGDMILIDTKYNDYKVDDIVTFYDKQGNFVTHRIIAMDSKTITTKGDNNNTKDEAFSKDRIVGKCVKIISNGGKVLHAFKNPVAVVMIFITGILVCVYLSLDKNGEPILTKEEREKEMFKKNKKFEKFNDDFSEFSEFDEELDLELEEEYDELNGTEEDVYEYYQDDYENDYEEEFDDDYTEEYDDEEFEEYTEEPVKEEPVKEGNGMSDIATLEDFKKYKEQQELEEFRRYKEQKEMEEFRRYKEQKELEEFKQFEASMKKDNTSKFEGNKNYNNSYKKNNKNFKKKN